METSEINAGNESVTDAGNEQEIPSGNPAEIRRALKKELDRLGGRKEAVGFFSKDDIDLIAPFEWCGKTYTSVHLDFASLTGADMENIDDELGGAIPAYPARSRLYLRLLAAKASGIPSDAIEHMPAADFYAITEAARHFLSVSG